MKALTIKQPWAHHIARGDKRIENRSWEPPESLYAEQFVIHAGMAWDKSCQHLGPNKDNVVYGAIIAVVRVSCIVRSVAEAERVADQGKWFIGPIGWVLDNVRTIAPVPCSGRQKLWNLSPEQEKQVLENLDSAAQFLAPERAQ
jgi:hypothetical protein